MKKQILNVFMCFILLFVISSANAQCDYSVDLIDSYGDGWNGGTLTININGTPVLSSLTIVDGGGPETYYFTVNAGESISTVYTPGSWSAENQYIIYDSEGNEVMNDGASGTAPTGGFAGFASCPSCVSPSNITITDVLDASANVTWLNNVADLWIVEYGVDGFLPGNGTIIDGLIDTTYAISGISPGSPYDVYVYSVCGADTSNPAGPFSFTTLCTEESIPWVEGFESGIPSCIFYNGDFTYATASDTYNRSAHSGTSYIYTKWSANDWVISNRIYLTAGVSYDFSFWFITDGLSGWTSLEAAYGNGQVPDSLTNILLTISSPVNTTYTKATATFSPAVSGYYNLGIHLTATSNPWYMTFDDFVLEETPTCLSPVGLNAFNITTNAAELSWQEAGAAAEWNLQYGLQGFGLGAGTAVNGLNDSIYNMTGLSSNTGYDYYVQSICGPGDTSMWVGPFTFVTDCGVFDAPFSELFSTGAKPICWDNTAASSDPSEFWKFSGAAGFGAATNGKPAGTYAWVDGSTPNTSPDVTLTTPWIDISMLSVPMLSFEFFSNNTDAPGDDMTFYVDVNNGTAWTNLLTYSGDAPAWIPFEFFLSSFGDTVQLRFVADQTTATTPYYNDLLLDVVKIAEGPTCPYPSGLTSSAITDISFDVSWTTGGASNWNIEYGPAGFTPGTGTYVADVTNPYTISGLTASTDYDVYVQDSCATDDVSSWTGPLNVTTSASCPEPTNIVISAVTESSATVSWTAGIASNWDIEIDTAGFTPTGIPTYDNVPVSSLDISGLNSDTYYELYIRTDCTTDSTAWIGPIALHTLCNAFTVPFIEDFETPFNCWTILNENGDADLWTLTATNVYEGLSCMSLYTDFNSSNNDWLISPTITLSGNERLRFWTRARSVSEFEEMKVLISTTGIDPSSFTDVVMASTVIDNLTYEEYVFDLSSYSGNVNIAFVRNEAPADGWYLYLDYVVVEELPSCPEPTELAITAINNTSAVVTWVSGGATEWNIEYGPQGFSLGAGTYLNVVSSPFDLTGLDPATVYDIYVRDSCGTGDLSTWVGPVVFTTELCDTTSMCAFSFNMEDTYGDGWNDNLINIVQNGVVVSTVTLIDGFSGVTDVFLCEGVTTQLEWIDGSWMEECSLVIQYPYGDTVYSFTAGNAPAEGVLHTFITTCNPPTCPSPTMIQALSIGATDASFFWTTGGASNWNVEYGPAGFTLGTGIFIENVSNPLTLTGLNPEFDYQIYVQDSCGAGDVSFWEGPFSFTTEPTCPMPANLGVSALTSTSAELFWTTGGASNWNMIWGIQGFDLLTQGSFNSNVPNPFPLGGLTAETSYDFYIQDSCGVGDVSNWSGPYTFTTLMGSLTNPSTCSIGIGIPDQNCIQIPVFVDNAPGSQLGYDVILSELRFIIEHTFDGDLDITLYSPSGIPVEISTDNGSSGDNYGIPDSVCTSYTSFSMTGADGVVTSGVAPFTGSFIPEGDFADFNDLGDPIGDWILEICDDASSDIGTLEFVELIFDTPPPADLALVDPVSGDYSSCTLTANDVINMSIQNVGGRIIPAGETINVTYEINGTGQVNEAIVLGSSLSLGDILDYSFSATYDFSAMGIYSWSMWINYADDLNGVNDIAAGTIENIPMNMEIQGSVNDTIYTFAYNMPLSLETVDTYDYYNWWNSDSTLTDTVPVFEVADFGVWYYVSANNYMTDCDFVDSVIVIEIPQSSVDVAITGLESYFEVCDMTADQIVQISLQNVGTDLIASGETINCSYQIDGGSIVSEPYVLTSDFLPGTDVIFAFATTYDFSALGIYDYSVAIDYAADLEPLNDQVSGQINHVEYILDLNTLNGGVNDTILLGSLPYVLDAGSGYEGYLWNDGTTTQHFTVNNSGWYSVEVFNSYGCYDFDSILVLAYVGIEDNSVPAVSLYPNPAKEFCTIELSNANGNTFALEIRNIDGKQIMKQDNISGDSYNLDMTRLPSGIYIIKVTDGADVYHRKLVKQ